MEDKGPTPTVKVVWNRALPRVMALFEEGWKVPAIHQMLRKEMEKTGLPFPTLETFKKYFTAARKARELASAPAQSPPSAQPQKPSQTMGTPKEKPRVEQGPVIKDYEHTTHVTAERLKKLI